MTCEKHKDNPVKIYHECVGCELESSQAEIQRLKRSIDEWIGGEEEFQANDGWAQLARLKAQNETDRETIDELTRRHNKLMEDNERLREALESAGKLASAVDMYDWIYMLMDDDRRNELYDAVIAWRKVKKDIHPHPQEANKE